MSRTLKQILIAVVFFLIIGLAAYALLKPEPTCSDGIQNQGEEGVDCGGPCDPCLPPPPPVENLSILLEEIIPSGQNFYDLVAQVKNPNSDYGAELINYSFEIYDENNSLIDKKQGGTFILPGEKKFIIEPLTTSERASKVDFKISEIDWQRLKVYEEPEILIKGKTYQSLAGNPYYGEASGVAVNESNYDFDKMLLNVVLFDRDENVLGAGSVELSAMLSGEERYFNVNWPYPISGEVSYVEMEAETNVFDSENFMKRHGTNEKFKQYR